eukprot:scaffold139027_cov20-Tisochrysis_lutea.AAC.1
MSGLALRLSTRDARTSLASAFVAAAQLLDGASSTDAAVHEGRGVEGGEGGGEPMAVDEGRRESSLHPEHQECVCMNGVQLERGVSRMR